MRWLSGVNVLLGIWLILMPGLLGMSNRFATASAVLSGIVIVILGTIRFYLREERATAAD